MTGESKPRFPDPALLSGLFLIFPVLLAGCASSVSERSGAAPKEHTGPITVDIAEVPAGSTTLSILKDKQDCDSYSHFDARLFAQCMERRGYSVVVYGADHQRTTIQELYAPKGSTTVAAAPPSTPAVPQNSAVNSLQNATPPAQALPAAIARLRSQLEQHQEEVLFVEHPRVSGVGQGTVVISQDDAGTVSITDSIPWMFHNKSNSTTLIITVRPKNADQIEVVNLEAKDALATGFRPFEAAGIAKDEAAKRLQAALNKRKMKLRAELVDEINKNESFEDMLKVFIELTANNP